MLLKYKAQIYTRQATKILTINLIYFL